MSVQRDVSRDAQLKRLRIKVAAPSHVQFSHRLIDTPVGSGLPDADELRDELVEYCDILLGRNDPPVDSPYLQLAEVATAYYARALEIDQLIHDSNVSRGHPLQRFRTGRLRSFIEMSKKLADLGSRRLTQEQILAQQRRDAGE